MSKQLQLRRGTTAQNRAFVGAEGELSYDTQKKSIRVHDGSTVGGSVFSCPIGMISPFAGSTAPDGWLICDGSSKSRYVYADLYAVIGTTYGDAHLCFTKDDVDYFIINTNSGTAIQTYDPATGTYTNSGRTVSSVVGDTLTDDQSATYTKDSTKDNPTFNLPNKPIINGVSGSITGDGNPIGVTCQGNSYNLMNGWGSQTTAGNRSIVRLTATPANESQPMYYRAGIKLNTSTTNYTTIIKY